jgi:excisionase family DNA binding protein
MTSRISYSINEAAVAVGVSVSTLRAAYRNGELDVHYPSGGKPLILHEDLVAWVAKAPTVRAS